MSPVGIAVNSQTNKVYVANSGDGSVTVIDGATNQTQTISVVLNPQGIAINSVTNTVYVAGGSHGSYWVEVIEGATLSASQADTNNPSGAIFSV